MQLSPEQLQRYASSLSRRQQRDRLLAEQRRQKGLQQADNAAHWLKTSFGVKEVILFGSLLSPEQVHLTSDIDLAVRGLASQCYCEALGALLCQVKDFDIDLVRIEDAQPSLVDSILRQGIYL